ncbi:Uncharacterised protein [Mycobacteroides abscessus subsp. abscessus]|nr:Uncharacterised protein [Mycobacteroides abscessus subsp. abscessus]SIB84302.1 Uncharacterised protein [Mycobacteroides abscessus subsp. abscessus]SIC59297.1 Uncharacterised protein [Mycobacteroides abscessus subsp. abscessus]SIC77478.1 Uncharacterised protein [Mycobacteroides abscessus subsp. abscessus]SID09023.1 Uncharacterised protein [Mycobacteroides abscessus subsp. abscessus]
MGVQVGVVCSALPMREGCANEPGGVELLDALGAHAGEETVALHGADRALPGQVLGEFDELALAGAAHGPQCGDGFDWACAPVVPRYGDGGRA